MHVLFTNRKRKQVTWFSLPHYVQAITYNESREEPSWILLSKQIRIRHPGKDKWPKLKWHTEVMRCFSFCSGLYAIYDVITVPLEGIFSFEEGAIIK